MGKLNDLQTEAAQAGYDLVKREEQPDVSRQFGLALYWLRESRDDLRTGIYRPINPANIQTARTFLDEIEREVAELTKQEVA